MNSSDEIRSVRLASGVEMQQRWPSSSVQNGNHQQQKNDTEAPRLIEMAPTRGNQSTVITVVVQSLPHERVPVKLAFNSLVVDTKQMQSQGITSLVAVVPPFQQTHSATANVPISVCMLDKDSVTETWPVAEFIYEFEQKEAAASSTSNTPTMTSATTTSTESIDYASEKCHDAYQSRREKNFLGGSYGSFYQPSYTQHQMPQYAYPYNNNNTNSYNEYNTYRPSNDYNSMNLFNTNSTAGFTSILTAFNQNGSITPTTATISQQQPVSYAPPQQPVTVTPTPTTQRQTTAYGYGKSSVHIPSTSVANYQPYPGLVSRANLNITGDLDAMAKNWQPEEWEHRRRLVQFWREQTGNEIRCTFDRVAQGERITSNSGHIVVSCIYWAERNECFITSVDCIHLLESLMDIRFSVEEKNRVRRNLEGFRPLTVSKCKAGTTDFFKLIMGFPNPKPRNIEKDVKVFPWKTLPYALKKIVTKYTASSYNNAAVVAAAAQQRRVAHQMTKNATITPPIFMSSQPQPPPSQEMNTFYPSPPFNAYHQQQNEQLPVSSTSSMYPSSSIPAYSSSLYSQPQSPVLSNTPSPRLQYPYTDIIETSTSSTSPIITTSRRPSQDYLV